MTNKIEKIKKVPLREIWEKEDKDFTKWLEENIDYLNDVLDIDFNIISSEKPVGPFRVDLYGEDNTGEKVIVENQLNKTDHTHLGQVITYLTNLEAKTAIWITSDPKEEHIKAIEWLNETTPDDISFYLIKLEAIKIGESSSVAPLFTIIKRPTFEGKQIGAERKKYAQMHILRKKFWTQFLEEVNKKNSIFRNINPTTDSWISIGIGITGVGINLVISKKYARSEVYINRGNKEENKKIFDRLFNLKDRIEKDFDGKLIWERMEDNVTSRIKHQLDKVDVSNEKDWSKMNDFIIDGAMRMRKAFRGYVSKLRL